MSSAMNHLLNPSLTFERITTTVPSTRRMGKVSYSLAPDRCQRDHERQLLTVRLTEGLMLPPGGVSTTGSNIVTKVPVSPSGLAFYRLKRAPSSAGPSYEGEYDIMLSMRPPESGTQTDTVPVVWDTSGLRRPSWWGDVATKDFTLTRFPDGSPCALSVKYGEGTNRGDLPEGDFFLEHRTDWVGYQPFKLDHPMPGNTTLAGPIFLRTNQSGETTDPISGSAYKSGKVQYFVHPTLPLGKLWLTPEEETARLPAA